VADHKPSVVDDGDGEARVRTYAVAALDELPAEFAARLENVQFFLQRTLTDQDRRRLRMPRGELYGLYEGIPLTRRGGWYNHVTPDRITLFWGPLLRDFADDGLLAEKVRSTVYHEIAHYFGFSEVDLAGTRVK
jgi:predicted Zn-dependent protease with MMP-like domain